MHYDLAIVGAGMSGLAAGIRAAHFGRRVCILEKHTIPGGLNSFYRLDGRNFDVGLHAMTNFMARPDKRLPLSKALRQLRLTSDDLALCPQRESSILFPGVSLRFSNDPALLIQQIAARFPSEQDGFAKLLAALPPYEILGTGTLPGSARKFLAEFLREPLLIEMLLCPVMYYGSPTARDMSVEQFTIIFRSIFLEGFARPLGGVRRVIAALVRKYKSDGGELRMGTGVSRFKTESGRVAAIELDGGVEITADTILSCAGAAETARLHGAPVPPHATQERMTFMESIAILDTPPANLGHETTIAFFNAGSEFKYENPDGLCDFNSGVICCPGNFAQTVPEPHGAADTSTAVRLTCIANYDRWKALPPDRYAAAKRECYEKLAAQTVRFMPDYRAHVTYVDTFTPLTIERFTSHVGGSVYGAPEKRFDGRTACSNLFLCGTDQGFLGIVGALLSGVTMANAHVLRA